MKHECIDGGFCFEFRRHRQLDVAKNSGLIHNDGRLTDADAAKDAVAFEVNRRVQAGTFN